KIAESIRPDWRKGNVDPKGTEDLIATIRTGSPQEVAEQVALLLNSGIAPQSIWDGLLCAAGECLVRQSGIVALHAVTSTNAMHYAFQTAADDQTRRLLMLQNAAFLPMFIAAMKGRGNVADRTINGLEAKMP